MNQIFERERQNLEERVLRMAGDVETRLSSVLQAFAERDRAKLQEWISRDCEIDRSEVEIEEECLKILALHQPLARDLRCIIAALKLNNDLERIGDIVVNVADRAARLAAFPPVELRTLLLEMGERVREMLKMSLDSLCQLDVGMAKAVIRADDAVDALNVQVIHAVIERAEKGSPGLTEPLLLLHSMARDIERIGDHATNIAEDVAYLVDGTILRHQRSE